MVAIPRVECKGWRHLGLFLKREDQAFISGQSEPIEKAIPSRYGAGRAGPDMMGLA